MNPDNVISTLILGENLDYLLFKIAIKCAENGLLVWIISPKTFDEIPDGIKPPDIAIQQLLTFFCMQDFLSLLTHLNRTHVWHKTPTVIILKDFETYCRFNEENYNPADAALVSTTLLNSASVCALKNNTKVFILVSSQNNCNYNNKLQQIRDLYFTNLITKTNDGQVFEEIISLLNKT